MSILLVELNPDEVLVDESLFPNLEKDSFIYEHLRHYCSKFCPLPTIEVKVDSESVVVVRGHQYVAIAKELEYQRIRAVINKTSPEIFVSKLLQKSSVTQLDWKIVMQENGNELVSYVWFVFFFERSLNLEEQKAFEEKIVTFYRKIQLPTWVEIPDERIKYLSYPYSGCCAEFLAYVPIEDERWYARSKAVIVNFHCKYVPIASFQGQKFRV